MKDSLSSCSNSEEQEIQQLQKQAKNSKENSLNKLNTLQSTIQHLPSSNYSMYNKFRDAFQRLFEADERTFNSVLSRNMQNLERKLHKETFHEKDSNSDLRVIKVQFEQFIHSKVLEPSNYNSYDLETRRDFKEYTQMEAQTFKETITQIMNSIEQCIVERENHEQVLLNGLKSKSRNECNDKSTYGDDTDIRPFYDTEPMVEVPYTAEYNVFVVDTQHSKQPECINNTCVLETGDSNVFPDSSDMCDNDIQNDQNVVECDDERVALANLIANLKHDVDENKKIQKQLQKSNTTLAQELKGELVDQAWVKHSMDHLALRAPTAHDMQILIKTCLMHLALKTQNDSLAFVHEFKQEMHADLKYVESLEKEIDELKSDKAEFSNMYDTLLQELVRQATAYKSERSQLPTQRFASQVGVWHDLTKPVTPHSWPHVRKSSFAKPYDVNAPGPSRKSPKHVSFQTPRESIGSNDMPYSSKVEFINTCSCSNYKTYYASRFKNQESSNTKTKTFAYSDIQDLSLRYQVHQGRLLSSFQDDAKYEHVGQDTRSQVGKDDQD
nr:hypothetical protein [Tanacetum cinerariifolium]